MMDNKTNQCCVISGESGAGKTESAKHIVRQIIGFCQSSGQATGLEEHILLISPLLEAFGNAQTGMNSNSSRFGKYTRLVFDAENGKVLGVQLSEYLLEKSRVVEHATGLFTISCVCSYAAPFFFNPRFAHWVSTTVFFNKASGHFIFCTTYLTTPRKPAYVFTTPVYFR